MRRSVFFVVLMASTMVFAGVGLAQISPSPKEQVATTTATVATIPASITTVTGIPAPAEDEEDDDGRLESLTEYFEDAMTSWARPDKLSADYHSIASDMASVVVAEDPIWVSDTSRARTGIMLLGIAFWESRYFSYVDNGSCNKYVNGRGAPKEIRRLIQSGNCDGGWAHSMWQVHPMKWYVGNGQYEEFSGEKLLDRKTAIHAALLIARRSIRSTNGLCWYTGEGADGAGCPKAIVRFDYGVKYSRLNPFVEKAIAMLSP